MATTALNWLSAPARWPWLPGTLRAGYALVVKRLWSLVKVPVIADIPRLGRMRLEPWDLIDSRIFFFHVWEPGVTAFLRETIRPGAVVADIGANIGYDTLLMSRLVGPDGHVFAIEPGPAIRERLEAQITLNALSNVTVVAYGISDRSERRSFHVSAANLGASRFGDPVEGDPDALELRRLADVVPSALLPRMSFVKIDVEGMEAPVMRDIMTMLPDLPHDLCLCAELRVDDDLRPIMASLAEQGFVTLALPNHYSTFAYPAHPTQAEPKADFPDGQVDIAFKRG
ncbi:FkbM family methyltransferase [Sphingobium xanthum]|jgi:FkbM family methyltransferase|uniref:FkbM family methyltransferase n=1 Tax=Sphingobium xanthum TaxID=1387165 RepID=UPI001C8CF310|nr:FkbM family methyltransferase [Sphingobium xanthum]